MTTSNARPVALITGGTTGIGLATAQLLHEGGWAVMVTGRNPETLASAERALPKDVVVLRADARSLAHADRVAAELRQHFGKVDFAFLNAGVFRIVPFEAVDEATYDETFDVNVKGQFFTLQKILPLLGPGSSVVFTAALGAHRVLPGWPVYSATKGALLSLTRALAADLALRKIRVNVITPGPIETPAIEKLGLPAAELGGFREHLQRRVPVGRFGTAEEVARTAAFLASPAAAYINGAELIVDGGFGVVAP
jgi:NAD(P)-dependent dehydrogenase (short-subunit alcohol dehydrogenase family)